MIWPAEIQAHVEADTVSDLAAGADDPARNVIYLITVDNRVCGVTGFYDLDAHTLGLRWHGVTPEMRRHGVSQAVINLVRRQARIMRPEANSLVEYIRLGNKSAHMLTTHFIRAGFVPIGRPMDATKHPPYASLPADSGLWQRLELALKASVSIPPAMGKP
jgi:hypothetical protein